MKVTEEISVELIHLGFAVKEAIMQADIAREKMKEAKAAEDAARQAFIDALGEIGKSNAKVPGVGTLTAKTKHNASYNVEDIDKVMAWLRTLGHGDAIRETVLPSQFRSMVAEVIDAGQVVPEFVKIYDEVTLSVISEKEA